MLRYIMKVMSVALLAANLCSTASAEAWPSKPIKFIVPTPPGGSPDTISRLLAHELERQLGKPVVVENRPGAAGNIGMAALVRSAPDGYTIGYGNVNTLAINRSVFKKLPFDVGRDIAPVAQFSSTSNLLVVRPSLKVKNLSELIAYIKSHPSGTVSCASPGVGTTGHMSLALFEKSVGVKLNHVPYQGSSAAYQDLLGDRIDIMFDNIGPLSSYVQSGTLRAIAYTGEKRAPTMPQVPTMQEEGINGFVMNAWGGIVVPAGTPPAIIKRLNSEINTAMKSKAIMDAFTRLGNTVATGTESDFANLIQAETKKWAAVVKYSGVIID